MKNHCECSHDEECFCGRTRDIYIIRNEKRIWICWGCIKKGDRSVENG